jgi:hypothetical protein
MFTEEQIKELVDDGLSEEEIALLENSMALSETIAQIPENVAEFIEEYKTKVPDDTIKGMEAIAFAAQNDPEFFTKLMSLNIAMAYENDQNPSAAHPKAIEGLSAEEYQTASHNYFETLARLSESDRKEFLNLIANITPEQKQDMIARLKNN